MLETMILSLKKYSIDKRIVKVQNHRCLCYESRVRERLEKIPGPRSNFVKGR